MTLGRSLGCLALGLSGLALVAWLGLTAAVLGGAPLSMDAPAALGLLAEPGARSSGDALSPTAPDEPAGEDGSAGAGDGADDDAGDGADDDADARPAGETTAGDDAPEADEADGARTEDDAADGDAADASLPMVEDDEPADADEVAELDGDGARSEAPAIEAARDDAVNEGAPDDAPIGGASGAAAGAEGGAADAAGAAEGAPSGADDGEAGAEPAASSDAVLGPQAVNWPDMPVVAELTVLARTDHFEIYPAVADDARLEALVDAWTDELEPLYEEVSARLGGRRLERPPVHVVFARPYEARCPARGLASPSAEEPLLLVYADGDTPDEQIRAVLAHEIAHHLTFTRDFVGDAVLSEGIANWAAGAPALAWQGLESWEEAARAALERGAYVSVADPAGLLPAQDEDCIERRDRVYNIRAAFVGWLVERYGLETVLAMPALERELTDEQGDVRVQRLPDYEAATGRSLTQLEREWLAELGGAAPAGEAVPDDDAGAAP